MIVEFETFTIGWLSLEVTADPNLTGEWSEKNDQQDG